MNRSDIWISKKQENNLTSGLWNTLNLVNFLWDSFCTFYVVKNKDQDSKLFYGARSRYRLVLSMLRKNMKTVSELVKKASITRSRFTLISFQSDCSTVAQTFFDQRGIIVSPWNLIALTSWAWKAPACANSLSRALAGCRRPSELKAETGGKHDYLLSASVEKRSITRSSDRILQIA